jgi:hypothetical protein
MHRRFRVRLQWSSALFHRRHMCQPLYQQPYDGAFPLYGVCDGAFPRQSPTKPHMIGNKRGGQVQSVHPPPLPRLLRGQHHPHHHPTRIHQPIQRRTPRLWGIRLRRQHRQRHGAPSKAADDPSQELQQTVQGDTCAVITFGTDDAQDAPSFGPSALPSMTPSVSTRPSSSLSSFPTSSDAPSSGPSGLGALSIWDLGPTLILSTVSRPCTPQDRTSPASFGETGRSVCPSRPQPRLRLSCSSRMEKKAAWQEHCDIERFRTWRPWDTSCARRALKEAVPPALRGLVQFAFCRETALRTGARDRCLWVPGFDFELEYEGRFDERGEARRHFSRHLMNVASISSSSGGVPTSTYAVVYGHSSIIGEA